jgi:hypothetical protein
VDDHACRVDDAAQVWSSHGGELFVESCAEITRVPAGSYLFTRASEYRASRLDGARIPVAPCELVDRREVAQPHGRKGYSLSLWL